MMRALKSMPWIAVALLAVGACGADDEKWPPRERAREGSCAPLAAQICACDEDGVGVRHCSADGSGFGQCACVTPPEGVRLGGSTNGSSPPPMAAGLTWRVEVLDDAGAPVAGAEVFVNGKSIGTTDASGRAVIQVSSSSSGSVGVRISAPGFVDNVQSVDVSGLPDIALSSRLKPVGTSISADPTQPIVVTHGGATLTIPANALVDSQGKPPSGEATVDFTYVAPGAELDAVGTFGITGRPDEILQSLGLTAIKASADGVPLDLAPQVRATLAIPAPGADPSNLPPPPPLWSQNGSKGSWDQSAGSGWALMDNNWVAQIDALATWNCDFPSKVTCVRGALQSPAGKPLSGVVVTGLISGQAAGFLPAGTVQKATTGSAGTFCMEVVPNAQVTVSVTCPGGTKVPLGTLTAPNVEGARCSGNQCAQLPTVTACCFRDSDCADKESCINGLCNSNACGAVQSQGGNVPETRTVDLGASSGSFTFSWDMVSIKDRMIVKYEGVVLHDTGCVSGSGNVQLSYSGKATTVNVEVQPNCEGDTDTAWSFNVGCPQGAAQ